jgi:hypothetical protein
MIQRDVFLIPPRSHAQPNIYWKLFKPVYGLVSAPKAWYDKLCEVVSKHGFKADWSDEAILEGATKEVTMKRLRDSRKCSARVVIPPYSSFVARGYVVHAGDAHSGPDIGLRYHVHCRSNHDGVLKNVFMKPFKHQ